MKQFKLMTPFTTIIGSRERGRVVHCTWNGCGCSGDDDEDKGRGGNCVCW